MQATTTEKVAQTTTTREDRSREPAGGVRRAVQDLTGQPTTAESTWAGGPKDGGLGGAAPQGITASTAIVTYGRGWPALTAVRSLGRRGVRVVAGDSVPFAPSSFSRYCAESFRYPDPGADPEGFLDALEAVVRRELARGDGDVVLLPIHSETFLLAEHRARFEALGARLALPEAAHIEQTHDKGSLAALAAELGVRIPDTRRYRDLADVYRDAPDLTYPVFVKLRECAAGVGVIKVDTPEELVRTYGQLIEDYALEPVDYPLVQGFVAGDDYCVSVLFDHGRCVAAFTYHNLQQFPRTTGAGVLREAVEAPAAEGEAIRILEHLGWHGLAQLDFRWSDDGVPYLIELNPRFFGGLPQAVASGVDYPWLVFQLARGVELQRPEVDYDVRTRTPGLALLATLDDARRTGELRAGLRQLKGAKNDVVTLDDPMPALGILFPLAVLCKHGSLSTAVVLSEAQARARVVVKGFREHLRPSWTTLGATALLCLVATLLTAWSVTQPTLAGRFFALPEVLAQALVPGTGGVLSGIETGVFHLLNFTLLYGLAAYGLKLRDRVRARVARPQPAASR
jgi:biotin carboxylase